MLKIIRNTTAYATLVLAFITAIPLGILLIGSLPETIVLVSVVGLSSAVPVLLLWIAKVTLIPLLAVWLATKYLLYEGHWALPLLAVMLMTTYIHFALNSFSSV